MRDDDIALRFAGVRKTHRLYETPGQRAMDAFGLYGLLPASMRPSLPSFDALADVSFTIRRGERVGIVGRNGAGKTTLLKLVTGNFAPSAGTVERHGAVHSLMQTGVGFSNEMTGRQNIYAALAYSGYEGEQLAAAVADIMDFCELGAHIDQPLKTYSLGMNARLQFAAATAVDPDVLIIDEVLGAGDVYFTHKSAARVRRFAERGTTLLIVSHAMQQILEFCERVIWLDRGRVVMDGPALDVVDAYEVYLERLSRHGITSEDPQSRMEPPASAEEMKTTLADGRRVYRWPGKPGVEVARVELSTLQGFCSLQQRQTGLKLSFDLVSNVAERCSYSCRYIVTFWRSDGRRIARFENDCDTFQLGPAEMRSIHAEIRDLGLNGGTFRLSLSVYDVARTGSTETGILTRYDVLIGVEALTLPAERCNGGYTIVLPAEVH